MPSLRRSQRRPCERLACTWPFTGESRWGFAQLTFAGAVLGGMLVAVLNRRSTLPRRRFIQIAVALTALSCLAPAAGGDDAASKIGLIAIHLLAATIIAPVLARHTSR